jgi:hypothetical protein
MQQSQAVHGVDLLQSNGERERTERQQTSANQRVPQVSENCMSREYQLLGWSSH